jgi:hypothetical protein
MAACELAFGVVTSGAAAIGVRIISNQLLGNLELWNLDRKRLAFIVEFGLQEVSFCAC